MQQRVFLSQTIEQGGTPPALMEGVQLVLSFGESGYSASADCNTLFGSYEIDDGIFIEVEGRTTTMGCAGDRHAQDDWYAEFLGSKPSIEIAGSWLILRSDRIRIEFLDQEVATPDVPLVGGQWTSHAILTRMVVGGTDPAAPPTLSFLPDGRVEVFTGCSRGSASYRVDGARIVFGPPAFDNHPCSGDAARIENTVKATLASKGGVAWEITATQLTLQGDDFGLLLSRPL